MIKFLKITTIVFLSLIIIAAALLFTFFIITRKSSLDENKLISVEQTITIYDDDNNEITSASLLSNRKSVELESLQEHTINAFIASEDRTFYSHNGLNYKRMLKALYTNVISRSFKQGASTISQQLVKNTHLSGDKTIKRKLNEIKLTKELEKKYSKDDILEMYLNTIYFGHNCYGLESAAEFYFNKNAENLDLQQSATLAGLLASPNNYSPFKNPEKCLLRRNTVLKAMLNCDYISESQYNTAVTAHIDPQKNSGADKNSDYLSAVFDELEDIETDFYNLASGCKIYTYLKEDLQQFIESCEYKCDNAIIITSANGGINAFKSTIGMAKRQPGSTIKPIMVYAPAIEEKLIIPCTKILDEKIDYGGYSPENFDKKYHGNVTVADSIKYSYNIPAVKTLNTLTIDKAQKYLSQMNIELDDDEKNLSLALGGMKFGLSIKDIVDSYTAFANSGNYFSSKFIKKIVSKDGKIIYENSSMPVRTFSEGTCSLINDMLIETSKSGTAKKLKNFDFDVASKTGTCGNAQGNTDAYNISYTSEHCIGVWLGDKDNKRLDITGGNDCCNITKEILNNLYKNHSPKHLEVELGTEQCIIDLDEYTNNDKIVLADKLSPKLNIMKIKTIKGNAPKEVSTRFSNPTINKPSIYVEEGTVNIKLCQTKYYSYILKRAKSGNYSTIYDGDWVERICDSPEEGVYVYSLIPYFFDGKDKHYGKEITFPAVNIVKEITPPQVKIPNIAEKDWFNL